MIGLYNILGIFYIYLLRSHGELFIFVQKVDDRSIAGW